MNAGSQFQSELYLPTPGCKGMKVRFSPTDSDKRTVAGITSVYWGTQKADGSYDQDLTSGDSYRWIVYNPNEVISGGEKEKTLLNPGNCDCLIVQIPQLKTGIKTIKLVLEPIY